IIVPLAGAFSSPASASTNPVLATGKLDYHPEEIVDITGSGFDPGTDYAIPVLRPDGTIVKGDGTFSWGWDTANTDGSGNLSYNYQLDGVQGTYEVRAYPSDWSGDWELNPIASVSFTDSASANLDQCG